LSTIPRIVLTAGEPAGIGPDLAIQFAEQYQDYELIVIADPALLWQRAEQLGRVIDFELVDLDLPATTTAAGVLRYLPVQLAEPVEPGLLDKRNADYVLQTLLLAHQGCQSGQFDAMVTCPVNKGVINDAELPFTGHTEFLAEQSGVDKVVMMLACDSLRVALATTHLPLREVSDAITKTSLEQIIQIIEQSMQTQFGIAQPKIAVCGLNPHAGEDGYLGREEIDVINPVIASFQEKGSAVSGSWPADTIFLKERLSDFDVVLAMYHDQGLPVLKHAGFSSAVNITLGLPYIRTSVDHGTALDLAASGLAKLGSLEAALHMARTMIASRGSN
jgi:4-hydroxythreonine-4-phosphate dehydrogenase